MARNRTGLSPLFRGILGSNNVYYQSPAPHLLKYPCIVYELDQRTINHADNLVYKDMNRYTVTLIGREADNAALIDQLISIPYCVHERRFITDNLYHDVFNLYY